MRTSNKLIFITVLVTLSLLVAYDLRLKAEYLSGDYKIPFKSYATLKWRDFDVVEMNSSTAANVKLVQGPFSVRIAKDGLDYARVRQNGSRLVIDADFENNYIWNPNQYLLVISCPRLTAIYASATYRSNNIQVTDTTVREDWNMRQVLIDGFKQDTLTIVQDYGSTVVLSNNTIRSVHAEIGKKEGSGSKIILQESNRFENVDLDIANQSKLVLENAVIQHLSYQLTDSAKLIISGKALGLLNHLKSLRQ